MDVDMTQLGDVLGRGMLPCGSDTCYLGSDPRLVSRVGGTYGVSDVDDTRRCLPWPRRLDDGARGGAVEQVDPGGPSAPLLGPGHGVTGDDPAQVGRRTLKLS